MYIAAIEKISPDYYEAATIEGANVFDKFFHITLPLIKGVFWHFSGAVDYQNDGLLRFGTGFRRCKHLYSDDVHLPNPVRQ